MHRKWVCIGRAVLHSDSPSSFSRDRPYNVRTGIRPYSGPFHLFLTQGLVSVIRYNNKQHVGRKKEGIKKGKNLNIPRHVRLPVLEPGSSYHFTTTASSISQSNGRNRTVGGALQGPSRNDSLFLVLLLQPRSTFLPYYLSDAMPAMLTLPRVCSRTLCAGSRSPKATLFPGASNLTRSLCTSRHTPSLVCRLDRVSLNPTCGCLYPPPLPPTNRCVPLPATSESSSTLVPAPPRSPPSPMPPSPSPE